mgnify:CR=1 FL=1
MELEVRDVDKEINFTKDVQREAIILAAYQYIKDLFEEGKITKHELNKVKKKYNIDIE